MQDVILSAKRTQLSSNPYRSQWFVSRPSRNHLIGLIGPRPQMPETVRARVRDEQHFDAADTGLS
jgi:hypothetical protein